MPKKHPAGIIENILSVSSVAQLCPTLSDPMNRSAPGLPVHHQLLEPTQTQGQQSLLPPSSPPSGYMVTPSG